MFAQKWDLKKKTYAPYKLSKGSSLVEFDMTTKVDCAYCEKPIVCGVSPISRHIHSRMGFGFSICENCSQKEIEKEFGKTREES